MDVRAVGRGGVSVGVVAGVGDSVTVEMRVKISVAKGVGVLNMSEKTWPLYDRCYPNPKGSCYVMYPQNTEVNPSRFSPLSLPSLLVPPRTSFYHAAEKMLSVSPTKRLYNGKRGAVPGCSPSRILD